MVLMNRNELCELCHIVLHRDDLQHNTAEISFPQTVELQYVELSLSNVARSLQSGSLQVYGRMGDCEAAQTFIELTDGPKQLGGSPELLDAKSLHTERLSIRGDFEEVTVRAIGAVISDANASNAAASSALQLSEVPQHLASHAQEQPIPSESLLPLQGLPQIFLQALEPIARYWQAVGMSVGPHWPECMLHYHVDETFSPLIGLANDLINVLTECTSASSLSLVMLERLKARLRLQSNDKTRQSLPSQVGELETHLFVRVVVAWMGLSAGTRQGEKGADDFCLFALAAALVLCCSKATAALFIRYGGVARCSQILSEHQSVPHSPYIRYTTAILAMLAECSTEAVTDVVMREKQPTAAGSAQSPAPEQRTHTDAPPQAPEGSPAPASGVIDGVDAELEPPSWEPPSPQFVVPGFGRVDARQMAASAQAPKAPRADENAARHPDNSYATGDAERPVSVDPSSTRNGETAERPLDEQQVPDLSGSRPDAQDIVLDRRSQGRDSKERRGASGSEGQQPGLHGDSTPGREWSSEGGAPMGLDTQEIGMESYSSDATSSLLGHTPSPEHSTGNNMEQAMGHSPHSSPDVAAPDTEAGNAGNADAESAERVSPDEPPGEPEEPAEHDEPPGEAPIEASANDRVVPEHDADVAMEDASPPADVPETGEADTAASEEDNDKGEAADQPTDHNDPLHHCDQNHADEPTDAPMDASSGDLHVEGKALDAATEEAPQGVAANGAASLEDAHDDATQGSPMDQTKEQNSARDDCDAVMWDPDEKGGSPDTHEHIANDANGAVEALDDVNLKFSEAGEGGDVGLGDEVEEGLQGDPGEGGLGGNSNDEEPNGSRKRGHGNEVEAHACPENASPAKRSREQDTDAAPGERLIEPHRKRERRERVCTGPMAAAAAAAMRIAAGEEPPAVPDQRPVLVVPAVADHLKPLPQLLCAALDAPHARDTLALGSRFLQHLALQEAIEVFETCTETLIGKVQQGAIGFSDADEGILRVARALSNVSASIEALCALPPRTWWREASHAMLKKLPQIPAGDASAFRCVAKRGILLRCMQMILLPPMIVNAIVEAGSALAAKERQSLERRLGTHFHTPLRGFFMVLFRTIEGFILLCNEPDTCQQLSAALASTPTHPSDETPLLPRTLPTASAPETTLATQLAFLATAKYAWDSVVGAASGTPVAMHAMHTLLHLTEDDEMCQMLARVLLVTPAAQEWLQATVLDAIAMDLVCHGYSAIDDQKGMDCPQQLRDRVKELSDPHNTPQMPVEAPFAPSVLHALCSHSLAMYVSSWARFLCPPESPIALSLQYKHYQEDAQAVQPAQPSHSLLYPQCRSQQIQWMWGCVDCLCKHKKDGISSILDILDGSLPPLTESSIEGLPQSQVDWASDAPLCPGNSPAFLSLRRSARARGQVSSALLLVTAALADVPDGVVTPVLAVAHSYAGGGQGGGLGILVRAVAVAVTWVHSLRSANRRALMLGDSYNLSDISGDVTEAMTLLQHACGALCGVVGALLKVPSSRPGVQGTAAVHVRWRGVCHVLLAAYNVVHWMPDNLRSLMRPPSEVTAALSTRHTIIATLQLWLTVQHPICPLQHALCAGVGRGASPVDDITAAAGETGSVKAWVPPAVQTSILCMIGDICAKAWPSSRSHTDRKLSEILPFGELRAAVAAATPPLAREIQALVHTCSVSHCSLLQAAFARFLPRLLSCSASMGTWLLSPILWDLKALVGSGKTHLQVHRVHALLKTTVPMLYCPLFKAHMRDQKFEELLCDVLHRSVGAWTEPSISDEHCVALQAVCQVVVDALKIMCDVKVSMAPGETVAERAKTDLPASKHLLLVVCTLLECLPFLEGSSDSAVNILSELIKGTAAPHIVNAVRKGAQAAAQAFTAEERDALGVSTLAIATTGTSPLIYLADQLTKRADTLRTHGKFVSTMSACTTASELMRHLDTVPETADAASASDRTPQDIITQRYAAAAAAGSTAPAPTTSATTPPHASFNYLAAPQPAAAPQSLEVPLDVVGPLTLAHEADMSRFVEYAQLREMPAAAGTPLEEVTASSNCAPLLVSLMPSSLDPPTWRSFEPSCKGAQFSGTGRRKQERPSVDVRGPGKGLGPSMLADMGMDVKPVVPVSKMSAVGVKKEFMGPGAAAEAKPKVDSADLYSDIMTTGLHASQAARSTKPARNVTGASVTRTSKGIAGTPVRPTRTPTAPGSAQVVEGAAAAASPTDPSPPKSNPGASFSPVSSHSGTKASNPDSSVSMKRARALAMAGVLPASMRPDMPDAATPNASRPASTAHTTNAPPGQRTGSPSAPFSVPNTIPGASEHAATGGNGAAMAQKEGSHMNGRVASEHHSAHASTPSPTPDPASAAEPYVQRTHDVYSRSVPLPPPQQGSGLEHTQISDTGGSSPAQPSSGQALPPPPLPGPPSVSQDTTPALPPPPAHGSAQASRHKVSSGPGGALSGPPKAAPAASDASQSVAPPSLQGMQDLLKDPAKLRHLLSDPRWAAFFSAKLKSKLKPGS